MVHGPLVHKKKKKKKQYSYQTDFSGVFDALHQSKKISNDQELIQSDPTSYPQNQKGNN